MKKTYLLFVFSTFLFLGITGATNYSMEERVAYDYAFQNGITTMNFIDDANMKGNLTRIAMAKMISNYAINTLGLTPDTSKNCYFSDVSSSLDYQYDNGVTKACQLGLMGVGIDRFYPNGKVTRAEFGTVLSRALNAKDTTKLNRMNNATPYYSEHLNYLKEEGIMNNISNPNSLEMRGWVMIMLMRADKNSNYDELAKTKYFKTPMALITFKNSGDIITQDTDNLVYKNDILGFQMYLGSQTINSKIKTDGDVVSWYFEQKDSQSFTSLLGYSGYLTPNYLNYYKFMYIKAYDSTEYENLIGENLLGVNKKDLVDEAIIGSNNKYRFLFALYGNSDYEEYCDWISTLKCDFVNVDGYIHKSLSRGLSEIKSGFLSFEI